MYLSSCVKGTECKETRFPRTKTSSAASGLGHVNKNENFPNDAPKSDLSAKGAIQSKIFIALNLHRFGL